MESGRQELTNRLVEQLERMYVEVRHSVAEEWLDIELTIPQLKTLSLLRQNPTRMGAVAEVLGTSLPSATSMVDRLVDKGLVERVSDPHDRRVVTCQLTPKGQEEVERFWRVERMTLIRLADHMSLDELETVINTTEILLRASHSVQQESKNNTELRRLANTAD